MNPVYMLTRNNLKLTKKAFESACVQDLETNIYVGDNGSTDGTYEWARKYGGLLFGSSPDRAVNVGVSRGWNIGLNYLFASYRHVLVINNDVCLPEGFYRDLLSYDVPFVTGVAMNTMEAAMAPAGRMPLEPHPDFSAFLIRLDCWEKVGPFDDRMKHYASDCDFHVRAHRMGIPLWKANVPYYHESSATLKYSSPEERAEINEQANKDRAVFKSLYGCLPGTPEYEALFK